MLAPTPRLPPGRWVGDFTLTGGPEFVILTVTDNAATLDVPRRGRFNLPVTVLGWSGDAVACQAGEWRFGVIEFAPTLLLGTIHDGAGTGPVAMRLSPEWAPGTLAPWLGSYAAAAGPGLMLTQDHRPEGILHFCVRGDDLLRLHPIDPDRFACEDHTTLTLAGTAEAPRLWLQASGASTTIQLTRSHAYRSEALTITVGDHALSGTLLLPSSLGRHPAVVFCHHADTPGRDYYRLFAAPFAERGLAAFIYDKRGWGGSTGQRLGSQVYDLADDAEAVCRALAQHPAVRPEALGLWGISNGAWVAAEVAARLAAAGQPPAFVIAASLAGVTPARQEQVRRLNVARGLGASDRALALLDRFWDRFFRFAIEGGWNAELEALVAAVFADDELRRLPPHPTHGPSLQPVPPVVSHAELQAKGATWTDGSFDPVPRFAALPAPVLCVWGADDDVIPLDESVARMRPALAAGGHPSSQLRVLPGANHLLYVTPPAPEGLPADVMQRRLHQCRLAPGARELMVEWAAHCVGR